MSSGPAALELFVFMIARLTWEAVNVGLSDRERFLDRSCDRAVVFGVLVDVNCLLNLLAMS